MQGGPVEAGLASPAMHACCRACQVRLLKCLVDNIVVDISFNQLGGLCTLAFLENMDRRIDQDHLFKKSIILVRQLSVPARTRAQHRQHACTSPVSSRLLTH